jgi:hypothetical protein
MCTYGLPIRNPSPQILHGGNSPAPVSVSFPGGVSVSGFSRSSSQLQFVTRLGRSPQFSSEIAPPCAAESSSEHFIVEPSWGLVKIPSLHRRRRNFVSLTVSHQASSGGKVYTYGLPTTNPCPQILQGGNSPPSNVVPLLPPVVFDFGGSVELVFTSLQSHKTSNSGKTAHVLLSIIPFMPSTARSAQVVVFPVTGLVVETSLTKQNQIENTLTMTFRKF